MDEIQWTTPDANRYWSTIVTSADLDTTSPTGYLNLTEYSMAYMSCYIRSITAHAALQSPPYPSYSGVEMLKSFVQVIN